MPRSGVTRERSGVGGSGWGATLCDGASQATVEQGGATFPRQFGRLFWDDLSADSGRAASFDGLMGARLVADAPAIAAAYPWGTLGHVVDVGSGNGTLLIAILRAHDDLRGTVIDLAGPVARAEQAIASTGACSLADTVAPLPSRTPW
jgi:hypothetical protein